MRFLLALLALTVAAPALAGEDGLVYPEAHTVDVIDDYHGTRVADPYRWLEDVDSEETAAWVTAQNELTHGWLADIEAREPIVERLTELWDYEKYSTPWEVEGRYFFFRNDGLQDQSVLYVQEGLDGEPRVLLDPNTLSEDGTVALGGYSVSEDGSLLAWATSDGGSDWRSWHVRDIGTGEDLEDEVRWSKFSGASWAHDNSGFFYSRYDEPVEGGELEQANRFQKLYFHRIGTPQSEDVLVYERPDQPEWGLYGQVSDDGRYLVITVWQGSSRENRVFYRDLQEGGEVVELLPDADASYSFVGNEGSTFFFRTDLDAPRYRLIAIDTTAPARENWRTVIPQAEDVLQSARIIHGEFVTTWMHNANDIVRRYALDGALIGSIELPTLGSVGALTGGPEDSETFYSFTSFLYPTTVYRFDFGTGLSEVFRAPDFNFDTATFETKQVFYTSKDGTRVPMFLVHRKGLELDGNNPTYLYGYGGFNVSQTPRFSVSRLVWLEMGGVFALANLRGGGEFGEEWHQAGMKENKQNVFDDFIAAGEWLVAEGYTRPERLAIAGGSNGGLLVGACLNQRPDLFGAGLPAVGVMDMLRFHKFTIGWAWVSDYGSSEDPEMFPVLHAYSPYHNIVDGTEYPATFITTADRDDRVVPGHSFKYAARLQAAQGGDAPILIRIQTRAGHGAGKPTSKVIEEQADQWAFLVKVFDMEYDAATVAPGR